MIIIIVLKPNIYRSSRRISLSYLFIYIIPDTDNYWKIVLFHTKIWGPHVFILFNDINIHVVGRRVNIN